MAVRDLTRKMILFLATLAVLLGSVTANPYCTCPPIPPAPVTPEVKDVGPCWIPATPVNSFDPLKTPAFLDALDSIDDKFSKLFARSHADSMAYGIVYNGEVMRTGGFGSLTPDNDTTPDANSLYRIGSLSKLLTTINLLKLRQADKVSLDGLVSDVWPEFKMIDPYSPKGAPLPVTWLSLANHMAGLMDAAPCDMMGRCNFTTEVMLERMSHYALERPMWKAPVYSNFGFALLGRALERLTGISWETYLERLLLTELGMTRTFVEYDAIPRSYRCEISEPAGPPPELLHVDLGWVAPAGSIYSSVNDLMKLMNMLLSGPSDDAVLPQDLIDTMFRPVFINENAREAMASPFEMAYRHGAWWFTKAGDIPGYMAHTFMERNMKIGVVVLIAATEMPFTQSLFTGTAAGILLDTLNALNIALAPPLAPPQFPGADQMAGRYTSAIGDCDLKKNAQGEIEVFFGGMLMGRMGAVKDAEGKEIDNIARLDIVDDPSKSCFIYHMDGMDGSFVYFDVSCGEVKSMKLAIAMPNVFTKV